jgi:hypothetical protein
MKFIPYLAALAMLALMISANAFAKDSQSGSFTVAEHVRIGSTILAPGNYKAEWSGPANHLKVDILHNGKTVATVDGSLKDLPQPAPYTAVVTRTLPNNTKAVDEIEFNHRSEAIVFPGA